MNILAALALGPTGFRGHGVNEEREAFASELRVQVLEGGRAALLSYTASLGTGAVVHAESSLLGTGPDGKLCLWPVMSEIAVILAHVEVMTEAGADGAVSAAFGSGPRDELASFREEITIRINADRSFVYAHAWGLPGGAFEDRSSCRMVPAPANEKNT